VRFCDVVIRHTGYTDAPLRRKKLERDLRLLLLEDLDRPDHPFTLFNLGSVQQELGRTAEALFYFRRSLALSHPADSIVRKLYALIGQCHRNLGQPQEALGACQEGRGHYPDDAELLFLEALLRQETGDARGAIETYVRLIEGEEKEHFASVASGLRGYKAQHQLALLYRDLGHGKEAEVQWQSALAERPDFVPGWISLGELFLAQGRLTELDEVLCRLGTLPQGVEVAAALRARGQRPGG
jgi:tetratricopeptide (TPR) repeat protein